MDYDEDADGIELPFDLGEDGVVEIKSAGAKTVISVVVPGQQYYAPQNASFTAASLLAWQAPQRSRHALTAYNIRKDGVLVAVLEPDVLTFDTQELGAGVYSITALYEGDRESSAISAGTPVKAPSINQVVNFKKSGFSIPDVFASKMNEATIEFWIQPNSLTNWNQTAGPGWGQFMFHANSDGSFTAGWNTTQNDRCSTASGKLGRGAWAHVAMVIDRNTLSTYINGTLAATCTSSSYSGIGGFGDLTFAASTTSNSHTDASMDEIRIWNYARTAAQIAKDKNVEFVGELLPDGLVAYYKGDLLEKEKSTYLRDCSRGHHACILNENFAVVKALSRKYSAPTDALAAEINEPDGPVYVGQPVTLTAARSETANALAWTAEGAGVKDLRAATATLVFGEAGEQEVRLTAFNTLKGTQVETVRKLTVLAAPEPDAAFTPLTTELAVGERVSFVVDHPQKGYMYDWNMAGADVEYVSTVNAAATYSSFGEYTVTLTVTAPDGRKNTSSCVLNVSEVAPCADFAVTPAVVVKGNTTFLQDNSKYDPQAWTWQVHSEQKDYIIHGRNCSFSPDVPGVYDVTLHVSNPAGSDKKTGSRNLIVTNADSKNGLNFSQNGARVKMKTVPFTKGQKTFTMEWWMRPNRLSDFCLGIGESESSFFVKTSASGAMLVYINSKQVATDAGFVIPGQWHHYAVSYSSGTIKFLRDGVLMAQKILVGGSSLPEIKSFSIGNSAAEMNGSVDEFRIWGSNLAATDKVITDKLHVYANQPLDDLLETAEAEDDLKLYYSFNQNGGDVQDLSSNGNTGMRIGFGPDGDAWGLSKGVFCLNFDEKAQVDVTAEYLTNYQKPFKYNKSVSVNGQNTSRWYAITDWTLENVSVNGNITTGVHVDLQKNTCFTATSGWDGFATLADHKAFQTVDLPAGIYTLSATYDFKYEGNSVNSYLVAAEGTTLPNTAELAQKALGYTKMVDKGQAPERTNSVSFFLAQPATVSLGLVVNMSGNRLMALEKFTLLRSDAVELDADNATGYDLAVAEHCLSSLYLPYSVSLPEGVTAYVASEIDESKHEVNLVPVTERVLPARTGAIIQTEAPGTYHFTPVESTVTITSLLQGVTEDTAPEEGTNYMVPAYNKALSFVGLSASGSDKLPANRVFFTTQEAAGSYTCHMTPVAVDKVVADTPADQDMIYDLFGRRLTRMTKPGVYIVNGKKVLVK